MTKNLLDRVYVQRPCNESWERMTGNDTVRFCSHCARDVYDLSSMTRSRAERLILDADGRLCVRYKRPETAATAAPASPIQITRRPVLAAGILAGALACSHLTSAQIAEPTGRDKTPTVQQNPSVITKVFNNERFNITGVVVDPNGAVVPGASIILRNVKTEPTFSSTTDSEGRFEITNVLAGDYEMEIFGVAGFMRLVVKNLNLVESLSMTQTLQPSPVEEFLLGVVGFVDTVSIEMSDLGSLNVELQARPLQKPLTVDRRRAKKRNGLPK